MYMYWWYNNKKLCSCWLH